MNRSVTLMTVAGADNLSIPESLTIEQGLRAFQYPPTLFQGYLKEDEILKPIPLYTVISTISSNAEIILQSLRNTDFESVIPQETIYEHVPDVVTTASDIVLGRIMTQKIKDVSAQDARNLILNRVSEFVEANSVSNSVVVGISGGGDSNTLAQALKTFPTKHFVFYTIIFEPLWPESASLRAVELCRTYNFEHRLFRAEDMEKLLNMKKGVTLTQLYLEFIQTYGDETRHFFGTYLISAVARALCNEIKATEYILGFNREDLLGELLFSLMNSQKPMPFPIRTFGEIRLLMPLWEIPKRILDACYPKYSFSNYKEREADRGSYQRSIVYYLAHGIEDVYPNLGLSLMEGIRKLFLDNVPEFNRDPDVDLYVSEYADKEKAKEIKSLFKKYFN